MRCQSLQYPVAYIGNTNMTTSGFQCALEQGHDGWHESWTDSTDSGDGATWPTPQETP